jgi:hypothetical protein
LPLDIKDFLKEDTRVFAFLAFGFLMGKAFGFWFFDVGGFGREKNC